MKIVLVGLFLSIPSFASVGTATVVLLRGEAKTETGKPLALKDTVGPGTTVMTGPKSFVKLLFSDQTQMNIGPDTTLKLEPVKAGEPSLVNLVGGQIRAKVTKDLLKQDGSAPVDKMQVKTKTAAMGIRGTDFNVTFNELNFVTALITFEGLVAMAKSDPGQDPAAALRQADRVQRVGAGQFSGAQPDLAMASVPVKISPAQLETLKNNETFKGLGEKSTKGEAMASPIPPGVDPKGFSGGGNFAAAPAGGEAAGGTAAKGPPPEGFFDAKTGSYAPRAGGFIDLASGRYVPPPPGSSFDANTGVFVPPAAMGAVDPATGMYVPPKGVELDPVKGFVAETVKAPASVATTPGAPPPPPPPPPAAIAAIVAAMNFAAAPTSAGSTQSFDGLFAPRVNNAPPPPPPPPPGSLPPPTTNTSLPPPPPEPISDPTCPTCRQDNVAPTGPTVTNLNFSIQVN